MKTTMTRNVGIAVAVMAALGLSMTSSGCDEIERELQRRCDDSKRQYEQALAEEQTELAEADTLPEDSERPAHLGVTLSNDLLSQLANIVVEPVIKGALEIVSTVEVDGKSVELRADGDLVELSLEADEACEHCFEVGVDLGGALVAEIPGVGTERANLHGAARLVVPLILTRGEDKSTAVKLDFAQLTRIGASNVIARMTGIDRDWERRLRGPLSDLILNFLEKRLEPVTLVEFDGPSFGLEGFELAPVELKSDADHGSVFAGFSANVDALNTDGVAGVESVTDLADDQNIALSFQPELIVRILSLLIGDESVARRYDQDGDASERGDFHVTLETFDAGQGVESIEPDAGSPSSDVDATMLGAASTMDTGTGDTGRVDTDVGPDPDRQPGDPTPVGLDFQVHNFNENGFCFSAGARMTGDVGVEEGDLEIGIRDVAFTSDTVPTGLVDIANWTTSQFIQESRTLVDKSFDGDNITVPGTALSVGPLDVGVRPNTLVLRGTTETESLESDDME